MRKEKSMSKRKVVSGSGIINTITNATNGVANVQLPYVNTATFSGFAKSLAGTPDMYQNAFMENLANLGFLHKFIQSRAFESYFRQLYGEDILEEQLVLYATDAIKSRGYDPDDTHRFLEQHPPRVGRQIMQKVLRRQYQVATIEDVITAIAGGEASFMSFYDATATQLWSSYEDDNLQVIKDLINDNITEGNLYLFPLAKPTTNTDVLALQVEIDTIANDWNSERYRDYNLAGFKTYTPKDALMYLFNNRISAMNKVYNLAWAFNERYVDLEEKGRAITMASDALAGGNVYSAIFDDKLFEIHNRIGHPKITSFYNPGTLSMDRLLTCFTLYGMNLFQNSVWFIDPSVVDTSPTLTISERDGSAYVDAGTIKEMYVDSLTVSSGKYFDKFGEWSVSGGSDPDTAIDKLSGELSVGANEASSTVLTVTFTSHLDNNVTATATVTVN